MPTRVLMPALSPTMEEGKLSKWVAKEGDAIKAGDVIAEIETDKATMEVEAVDEGRLGRILVGEGTEGVKVNSPIAWILGEGEDASAIQGDAPAAAPRAEPPPCRRLKRLGRGRKPATMRAARSRMGRRPDRFPHCCRCPPRSPWKTRPRCPRALRWCR